LEDIGTVFIRGEGCDACNKLGFADQTVAAEVIVTDYQLLRHIREGSMSDAYRYWKNNMHGQDYIKDAVRKLSEGILDPYITEKRLGMPLTLEPGDAQFEGGDGEKS
jgi:type II secretory ATPase GspE/PulE/Tfp pilus assembly ATPase PilB-like protein